MTVRAGVMLVAAQPPGIPYTDTPEVRLVRTLEDCPALTSIDAEERSDLVQSLAQTFARALYHRGRFEEVVAALAARAQTGIGWMAYDALCPVAVFEAASVLGAVRVAVDELIFLVARRHGQNAVTIDKKWQPHRVFSDENIENTPLDVEEIRTLRGFRRDWHDRVNVYRNMFHHRGWREGLAAYFPRDSTHPEASNPRTNVMLIPDRESLRGATRPYEWTYDNHGRLEDLVDDATAGLRDVLLAVARDGWKGALPVPGSLEGSAPEARPSMIASVPIPFVLVIHGTPVVRVFTTREGAEAYLAKLDVDAPHHVTAITASRVLTEEAHFVLAVPGVASFGIRTVRVEIDRSGWIDGPNGTDDGSRLWMECQVHGADAPGCEMLFFPARCGRAAATDELFILRRVL